MTVVLIIIVVLAVIVFALIVSPVGHAIRTGPRHLRTGGGAAPGRHRSERPFRRPRGGGPAA